MIFSQKKKKILGEKKTLKIFEIFCVDFLFLEIWSDLLLRCAFVIWPVLPAGESFLPLSVKAGYMSVVGLLIHVHM